MQLSPRTTGLLGAVDVGAAVAVHQSIPPLTAFGALLLVVLTAGVTVPAVWSRKPARRRTAPTALARLPADMSRSAASHYGSSRKHTSRGWLRLRKLFWHARWRQNMAVLAVLMAVAVLLLASGWDSDQYRQNIVINIGADLVGVIVATFMITPMVRRAAEGRVREHPRLDYDWYVYQVAGATSHVRIMDIYSNLLDGPHTANFFRAVELALERQAVVQILLLDPYSLAATQRTHELDDPNACREIMRNLRVLYHFRNTIQPASLNRNFSVRVYTASPSITVYRWDEKALVSFFPAGKISGQGVQLEVTIGSPLGQFVNKTFNSLWTASEDLERFMRLPVTLTDIDIADRNFEVEFIYLDGRLYVNDWRIVAQMARRRIKAKLAYSRYGQQVFNELVIVDDTQPELHAKLSDRFQEKYGRGNEVFIGLEPVSNDNLGMVQNAG
jgi:hypothetical protein